MHQKHILYLISGFFYRWFSETRNWIVMSSGWSNPKVQNEFLSVFFSCVGFFKFSTLHPISEHYVDSNPARIDHLKYFLLIYENIIDNIVDLFISPTVHDNELSTAWIQRFTRNFFAMLFSFLFTSKERKINVKRVICIYEMCFVCTMLWFLMNRNRWITLNDEY